MNSQKVVDRCAIPCNKDGTKNGHYKIKGHLKNPTGKKSGFIQATFYEDPARERADIPPGGARSWYLPETGRRRRIEQWQQLNPPFSF